MKKSILTLCLCPLNSISKTLSACFLLGTSVLLAQDTIPTAVTPMNNTGDLPYSTTIGTDIEHVDLASGNLIVTIPFVSVPGRKMSFDFGIRYDARFWIVQNLPNGGIGGTYAWNPEMRNWLTSNTIGWTPTQAYLTYSQGSTKKLCAMQADGFTNFCQDSDVGGYYNNNYIFTDMHGIKHTFYINRFFVSDIGNPFDSSNYVGPSPDMSGYFAHLGGPIPSIQGPDGTQYSGGGVSGGTSQTTLGQYFVNFAAETDLRGNSQIVSPGGTDSIGRTIVTQQTSANQIVYLVHDSNGSPQSYTVNLESIPISTQFNSSGIREYSYTRQVVSSIVLPNQQSYSFQYDSWGDIAQIMEPSGTIINYQWATVNLNTAGSDLVRAVTQRTVVHDGESDTWTLSYTPNSTSSYNIPSEYVTVTSPPNTSGTQAQTIYGYNNAQQLIQIKYLASPGGNSLLQYDLTWDWSLPDPDNLLTSIQTTLDNGMVSLRKYQYDLYGYPYQTMDCTTDFMNCWSIAQSGSYGPPTYLIPLAYEPGSHGNVTTIQEYDWGQGAPGTLPLVRQTIRKYLQDTNSNYFVDSPFTTGTIGGALPLRNIVNRVVSETIFDGSAVCTGTGTWAGDGNGTITPPPACQANQIAQTAVTYDQNAPSTYGYYGEATAISHWLNSPSSTMLTSSYTYDSYGNILTVIDPKNHTTTYGYSDAWAGSSNCAVPYAANAYLTSVTNALGQQSTQSYYECTGKLAAYKDANDLAAGNNGTTFSYDMMGRKTLVSYPDGGQTATAYNDSAHTIDVQQLIIAGKTHEALTQLDNLGRAVQTQLLSDPQGVTYATTSYDALGRKYQVSNPYRSTSDSTYGKTTFGYDALGRMTSQTDSDGVNSTQTWNYSGNTVTYTDEAGNQWARTTDALGRLKKVLEPNGAATVPSMETDYTYDTLNNLTCVEQHGGVSGTGCSSASSNDATSAWRVRRFSYDSLSRLLTAKNLENGTITYTYLTNGAMCSGDPATPCSKTDARGIAVNYTYDALNRLTGKSYSNSEPSVAYTYDSFQPGAYGAGNYGIGRRTSMTDASGLTNWAYDIMGRVWTEARTIGSVAKTVGTQYFLDGSAWKLAYPSGAIVEYTPGGAGRALAVKDDTNNIQYAQSALYAPQGALQSLLVGNSPNFAGMTISNQYNQRLQPAVLSVAAPSGTLMSLSYNFHLSAGDNGNVYGIANNKDTTRSQTFLYDTLNRVAQAQAGSLWGAAFTYDPWGNLYQAGGVPGAAIQAMTVTQQASLSNRFMLNGYGYDAAGNVLSDGLSYGCGTAGYAWNAEEQMSCGAGIAYTYDGDGERVKKSNGTLYWGGGAGGALAESDLAGNLTSEYIFFNGKRIARRDVSGGGVYYYFSDHLGSSNVVTNAAGVIQNESDFYPFGGESIVTQSLASQHYKFTGKERDAESGNDYFEARYYSSAMGRFMSPDWSAQEDPIPYAKLDNPQSLNLYQYVLNNPLVAMDDDGHEIIFSPPGTRPLKNEQTVRDSVTALLANPNTNGYLKQFDGNAPGTPDIVFQGGDLRALDSKTFAPDGTPGTSIVKGDTDPNITTDGKSGGPIITIDDRTSKDDTPYVVAHETVHGGESQKDPAQFQKDSAAEHKAFPNCHDCRPQEKRAIGVEKKYGPAISKAVKQIEKERKKEKQ
jgi:RHS repeat-associated protein